MRRIYIPFLVLAALLLGSCGQEGKETIKPLYATENLQIRDANVEFWSSIDMTTVEPSAVRKVTRYLFGWIPIVGSLMELPLDLTSVILPPLPATMRPELPPDGEWNDPRLLQIVQGLRLGAGFIRITPRELRGQDWKPEKCWFFFECDDLGFDDFLKEVRVYLIFKDLKPQFHGTLPEDKKERQKVENPEVLLATADVETDYDKETQTLFFNVSEENIRTYLDRYGQFEIKVIARGGFPKRKVYLDGRLRIDLDLNLAN